MKNLKKIVLGAALAMSFGSASAGPLLGQEPPANVIVERGNLEWVWASPCAGAGPSCGTVQLHHGWGFANDAQWLASFTSIADLQSAFVTPTIKCGSNYFSQYSHCDAANIADGHIWHSPLAFDANHANAGWGETFLVRAAAQPQDVPEPASIALLGLGLAGLAAARRKKAK